MISIHYRNNRQRMVDLLYSQTMKYMLKVYTKQKLRLHCQNNDCYYNAFWLVGRLVGCLVCMFLGCLFVCFCCFLFAGWLVGGLVDF